MNVASILEQHADERGDQAAVIGSGRVRGEPASVSFDELRGASASLGAQLLSSGIRPGDHVSLLTPLSIRLYVALIGALRIGAVPVVVDPNLGLRGMRRALGRVKPRAVIGTSRTLALSLLLPELWSAKKIMVSMRPGRQRAGGLADVESDASALITFTSGSTGQPKAVVRSHGLLLAQNAALDSVLRQGPGDVCLATLPIFVLANLGQGVTSVLADADLRRPGFIDARPVLEQIERHRPQSVVASPALLQRLTAEMDTGWKGNHRFDHVFTGGAPVFPDTIEDLSRLTKTPEGVVTVYGSTEAEPISHLAGFNNDLLAAVKDGAGLPVGRPVDAVQARIITDRWGEPMGLLDEAGLDAQTITDGNAGEIIVTGEHVVRGYLDGVGDDETKIRVGDTVWHRTGDAGRLEADGQLWLLGRASAKLLTDAGFLYPFEIEAAVRAATGLRCALVATSRQLVVESPTAPSPIASATLDDIIQRWGIHSLKFVNQIPMDSRHNAKVDYSQILD